MRTPGSWRWPAAFALVFLMTGMNAGVVALFMCLAVPCYLLYLRLTERTAWRRLHQGRPCCAVLAALVSLYWLVPAAMAEETGEAVAAVHRAPGERGQHLLLRPDPAAARLLGHALPAGRPAGHARAAAYLTNPLALVASFALPAVAAACALLARARARAWRCCCWPWPSR